MQRRATQALTRKEPEDQKAATALRVLLFTFNALSIKLRSHSSKRAEIVERARNQSPQGDAYVCLGTEQNKEIRL